MLVCLPKVGISVMTILIHAILYGCVHRVPVTSMVFNGIEVVGIAKGRDQIIIPWQVNLVWRHILDSIRVQTPTN